jgi:hypothetical protein
LSHTFSIKNDLEQADRCTFSTSRFNCAPEYAVKKVQANQEGLKLNGTQQLLISGDHANLLSENIHDVRNMEAALVASKRIDLEVNA